MPFATTEKVRELLDETLRLGSELDAAEWKSGIGKRPLARAICGMANRRHGGVIFVGVDEQGDVVGVPDLDEAQTQIGN